MLLKFAYEDFIADRKFKNTTAKNIQNYRQLLKPFIDYCLAQGELNVEHVNTAHVRSYLVDCQERGNKPSTVNSKLLRIRAFFNYLVEESYISNSPAKKFKLQKEDIKIEVFTDEQIYQMLAYYRGLKRREKTYFSYRGYMLIVLLLGTGLRRKEIINLKWSDVNMKDLTLSVLGKNRKYEIVFLTEKLAKELAVYGVFCKQHFGKENEYVFLNRDNTPMNDWSISQVFDNLRVKMGFENVRVSPHTGVDTSNK